MCLPRFWYPCPFDLIFFSSLWNADSEDNTGAVTGLARDFGVSGALQIFLPIGASKMKAFAEIIGDCNGHPYLQYQWSMSKTDTFSFVGLAILFSHFLHMRFMTVWRIPVLALWTYMFQLIFT